MDANIKNQRGDSIQTEIFDVDTDDLVNGPDITIDNPPVVPIPQIEQDREAIKPSLELKGKANNKFPCSICGKLLKTEATLKRHISTVHPFGDGEKATIQICEKPTDVSDDTKAGLLALSYGILNTGARYLGTFYKKYKPLPKVMDESKMKYMTEIDAIYREHKIYQEVAGLPIPEMVLGQHIFDDLMKCEEYNEKLEAEENKLTENKKEVIQSMKAVAEIKKPKLIPQEKKIEAPPTLEFNNASTSFNSI